MEDNKSMTVKKTVKSGITFGSALAMVISYTTWKSVGWAIFHLDLISSMLPRRSTGLVVVRSPIRTDFWT